MNYYRRWIGDYVKKTAHLSLAEHGAYGVLLDICYSTEKPLPASLDALCRLCRAMSPSEREAVRVVADEFFPVNKDGQRHNERADEELGIAQATIEKQRKSGSEVASKRKSTYDLKAGQPTSQPTSQPTGTGQVNHDSTDRLTTIEAIQPPTSNLQPLTANLQPSTVNPQPKSKALVRAAPELDARFLEFWASYPRKEARKGAAIAWKNLNPDELLVARILRSLEAHKVSAQWADRQFIPHPATWLNGRRWDGELPPTRQSAVDEFLGESVIDGEVIEDVRIAV